MNLFLDASDIYPGPYKVKRHKSVQTPAYFATFTIIIHGVYYSTSDSITITIITIIIVTLFMIYYFAKSAYTTVN